MGIFSSTPKSVTGKKFGGRSETRHYGRSGGTERIQRHDKGKTTEHKVGHGIFGAFVGSKKK